MERSAFAVGVFLAFVLSGGMDSSGPEKEFVALRPGAQPGDAPVLTISPAVADTPGGPARIRVHAETAGFWRSRVRFEDALFDLIEIPGGGATVEVGKPAVPLIPVEVEIPAGTEASCIIESASTAATFTDILPAPVQEPRPIGPSVFTIDRVLYGENSLYPGRFYLKVAEGSLGEKRILILHLFPIQFRPASRVMDVYSLDVVVELIHRRP